ncbi:hypothetical protein ACTXLT_03100 [Brachybacterium alimentarium]|uniref:hypothetical protein n=1 Tax=Brachybacterium alimentarium TaxID=47845 RepID=UPI00403DA680
MDTYRAELGLEDIDDLEAGRYAVELAWVPQRRGPKAHRFRQQLQALKEHGFRYDPGERAWFGEVDGAGLELVRVLIETDHAVSRVYY